MLYEFIGLSGISTSVNPPLLMLSFGLFVLVNFYLEQLFVHMRFSVNYKLLMLVTSVLLGIAFKYLAPEVIEELIQISPRTLLVFVHPLIILKVVFELDTHLLWKMSLKIFVLSTVCTFLYGYVMALALRNFIMQDLGHRRAAFLVYTFAFAGVDALEMSEVLSEIEGLKYVLVIFQSESVLGTGSSIMFMDIFTGYIDDYVYSPLHATCIMLRYGLGGLIVGRIFGSLAKFTMSIFYDETNNTIIACVSIVYITYYVSDCLVHCSAPLATFIVVYYMSRERAKIPQDTLETMTLTWNIIYSVTEYLMFVIVVTIFFLRALLVFSPDRLLHYISVYLACSAMRIIVLIVMYPFLMRINPKLEMKFVVALFWMSKKGVIQLLLISIAFHTTGSNILVTSNMAHTFTFFTMYILFNSASANYFYKIFGLTLLTKERKSNMHSCLRLIESKKVNFLETLKLSRQLSVVDWSLVEKYTQVTHGITYDWIEDDDFLVRPKKSVCLDCKREISVKPTRKELVLMMAEAKRRVLKAQKVSFIRQLEKGIISKDGVKALLTCYESAIDSKELILKVDALKYITDAMKPFDRVRHIFQLHGLQLNFKKPRNPHRRLCYWLIKHKAYDICIYVVTIIAFLHFCLTFDSDDYGSYNYVNYLFIGIYLIDFILKINGMTHILISDGFAVYFSNNWCLLDFILLVLNIISAVAITVKERSELAKKDITYDVMLSSVACMEVAKIIRLLRILQIVFLFRVDLLRMYKTRIGFKLANAFDLADTMIITYDEVLHLLPSIIDNENIRKDIRERMTEDRAALYKQIAFIEKTMPVVAAKVKTQQAIRSTLVYMKEYVDVLKTEGALTEFEHMKVMRAIQKRYQSVTMMKYVQEKSPEVIISELPWCANSPDLATYFNVNSTPVDFQANEIISWYGYNMQGIYVLVEGCLKMIYKPYTSEYAKARALPIIENVVDATFDEPKEDLLLPGNTLGELSTLTGRVNQCEIYSEIPVKTYFIDKKIMERALIYSESDIDGLYNALWMNNTILLAASILWEEPVYTSFKKDELLFYLMKGMVPNLSGAEVFVGSELIEDIVLIEGKVKDLYTEDIYCAPCFLPRCCQKLLLIKNTQMHVNAVLFVVPLKSKYDKNLYSTHLNHVDYDKYRMIVGSIQAKPLSKFLSTGATSRDVSVKSILRNTQSSFTPPTEESSAMNISSLFGARRFRSRRYSSPSRSTKSSLVLPKYSPATMESLKFDKMSGTSTEERQKYDEQEKKKRSVKYSARKSSSKESKE